MAIEKLLASVEKRSQFIAIHGYTSSTENVEADYSLIWHVDYKNAIKKSLEILKKYRPTEYRCKGKSWTLLDLIQARAELIQSFKDTLAGNNDGYTAKDAYQSVIVNDKPVPGLKKDKYGNIHLFDCFVIHTKIIKSSERKTVNSSSLTLAKNFLRKLCPVSKYRQFKLNPRNFKSLSIDGMKLDHSYFENLEPAIRLFQAVGNLK